MSSLDQQNTITDQTAHVVIADPDFSAPTKRPNITSSSNNTTELIARISRRDLCTTVRQLAWLLHAGMPLVPALAALAEQLDRHPLQPIITQLHDRVNAGDSLAGALEQHPRVFSRLFVNLVHAGQSSGTLEQVLNRLAQMLEKRTQLANKIKAALTYPLLMALVAAGVVTFLMAFVIPEIAQIFLEMNRSLPWPTVVLITLSTFTKKYFIVIITTIFLIILATALCLKKTNAKTTWDRTKLKLPLIGDLFLKIEMTRFARTLSTLLASGVPVLDAFTLTLAVLQNSCFRDATHTVKNSIERGDTIADAMKKTQMFPPIMIHTIAVGELSGNIEAGLTNIADAYDDEIESAVHSLTSILEPAIMLIMAFIVGFIVLAMLLPIFEINQML